MELPLILPLSAFDMSEQKNVEQVINKITLHNTYLEYELELSADEPGTDSEGYVDRGLPWQRVKTSLVASIKRERLIGVDMCYVNKSRIWKVTVLAPFSDCIVYFKIRTKAQDLWQVLKQYIMAEQN